MKCATYILGTLLLIFNNARSQDFSHKLYGYSQLDFKSSNDPMLAEGFRLTRINLIDDFSLQDNARFVVDLEFEDGADISPEETKGSIKVSRGFFEYNFKSNTSVSFGKVLTPFGLLNETHDFTITYLPIEVPLPYRAFIPLSGNKYTRVFSKYSTGVSVKDTSKLFQKYNWINQFSVGNGFSETNKGADGNHDKGLSFKSSLKYLKEENIYETGGSIYTENDSSAFGGSSSKRFYTYALHFKFENNFFNISSEVIYSRFNSAVFNTQEALAYYACAGYTLSERLTPYLLYTKALRDLSNKKNYDRELALGVNATLLQQVILKIEYTMSEREVTGLSKNYQTIGTTLAIAF
ncbi:MAG: hypothetical protein PHY93_08895 [Bacteriovorax sp.]|nr:hypothetical protein [Bacteriovorax sp.]